MLEKTCSHKYVDPKMEDSESKILYVDIFVGNGVPCFERKLVMFRKVLNFGPFVVLRENVFLSDNVSSS